ncbi:cytochrome c oxidase-assembly factor mitochondrial [Grosmannia clavigera kw1407]|uniref:Cytochrome c oxidase assembly protein COX16, mitochondrial n=1 Tax=Grosmannia clavigera (strain kw1407 / UAMH 11150) TaxID=655863 RepID=F0XK12_GROCL|nr:cytochrome c oxidase-assembly factor mitochondrial [Grosmannia clavigera kw1407]EFX01929.1 cytochrome c oxidase-assembly factor mitochondrial [Grosmannia clavigera kw1407]
MGAFQRKKFQSSADANKFASRYRAAMAKHPFLLFGLPFLVVMVGGSFVLTPATAIRYERHDRMVRQLSREEELGIGKGGRRADMREEYYRLAHKDLDNWEQKRVKRLKGENDGVL